MGRSVIAAVTSLLVACQTVQAMQGSQKRLDIADHEPVEFDDEADLDWTAGSVLGLQRGYTLHKREPKLEAKAHEAVPEATSLLGLQRSTKLEKVLLSQSA